MSKLKQKTSLLSLLTKPFKKRMAVLSNAAMFERFEQIRHASPYALTRSDLELIQALFALLTDNYKPTAIFATFKDVVVQSTKLNIEQVISEIAHYNRKFLARRETIPAFVSGDYTVPFAAFFIDDKERYIPVSIIHEYFQEVNTMINYLLEEDIKDDEDILYNLKRLSYFIYLQAEFGLTLCEDLKKV